MNTFFIPSQLDNSDNFELLAAIESMELTPRLTVSLKLLDTMVQDALTNKAQSRLTGAVATMVTSMVLNTTRVERLESLVDIMVYNKKLRGIFEEHGEDYMGISEELPGEVLESILHKLI